MNKKFVLNYGRFGKESVTIQVTDKFTKKMAEQFLAYFDWSSDFIKSKNPIIEAVYRVAAECLYTAKKNNYALDDVKNDFKDKTCFYLLAETFGMELLEISHERFGIDPNELEERYNENG